MLIKAVIDYSKSIEILKEEVMKFKSSIEKINNPEDRGMYKAYYTHLKKGMDKVSATSENLINEIDRSTY